MPAGAVRPQDGEASGLDTEVLHTENNRRVLCDNRDRRKLVSTLIAVFEPDTKSGCSGANSFSFPSMVTLMGSLSELRACFSDMNGEA